MRVQRDQVLYGMPVLDIRRLLRKVELSLTVDYAGHILQCSSEAALRVIEGLHADGYLERGPNDIDCWALTQKGAQLRAATAAEPISRKTADRLLKELLCRVETINTSVDYLHKISCLIVFGSYLTDATKLSDLDVGYRLGPKVIDRQEHDKLCDDQIRTEHSRGRRFRNIVDEIYWPQTKVLQALRGRAWALAWRK